MRVKIFDFSIVAGRRGALADSAGIYGVLIGSGRDSEEAGALDKSPPIVVAEIGVSMSVELEAGFSRIGAQEKL